jgi:hypothetical protein
MSGLFLSEPRMPDPALFKSKPWYDGMFDGFSFFDLLIENPAWFIGVLLGETISVLLPLLAIYPGQIVYRFCMLRGWHRKWVALPVSILVGIWAACILYRSSHWMAFAALHVLDDR